MNQRGYYGIDFTGFFIFSALIGAAVGALLMWLIPILWAWIKPIIHEVTK